MARMKRCLRRSRGLETVEAALILPLMLLVVFGILEYGWMFVKQAQITNITREAGRLAAMPDATTTSVNAMVAQMMANDNISGYQTPVYSPAIGSATAGQAITVTITVPYSNVGLTKVSLLPLPTSLQAQITMNKEGP